MALPSGGGCRLWLTRTVIWPAASRLPEDPINRLEFARNGPQSRAPPSPRPRPAAPGLARHSLRFVSGPTSSTNPTRCVGDGRAPGGAIDAVSVLDAASKRPLAATSKDRTVSPPRLLRQQLDRVGRVIPAPAPGCRGRHGRDPLSRVLAEPLRRLSVTSFQRRGHRLPPPARGPPPSCTRIPHGHFVDGNWLPGSLCQKSCPAAPIRESPVSWARNALVCFSALQPLISVDQRQSGAGI